MSKRLNWEQEGADWPNRTASQFVDVGNLRWHVQRCGRGPILLLVHGTGASTHSWRDVLPQLAQSFDVIAMDLPGHGFTDGATSADLSLVGMSNALGHLLGHLEVDPKFVVGHSAGAAILVHMCINQSFAPDMICSLNGALLPFPGMAGKLFPALAKVFYLNPVVPRLLSWRADDSRRVRRLIEGMGSTIDDRGIELYTRLFQSAGHMDSTLKMMAYWDLDRLKHQLPDLRTDLRLIVGTNDRAVPADTSFEVRDLVANAEVTVMRGGGHLMHEERPQDISKIIIESARACLLPV